MKLNSEYASTLSEALFDERKQIKVRKTLQLDSDEYPHIFAIGDVNNATAAKLGYVAGLQAEIAAQNIKSIIDSWTKGKKSGDDSIKTAIEKAKLKQFSWDRTAIIVTLGKEQGVGQLGAFTLGDWFVKTIKGKDMGLKRFYSGLNLPSK